MTPFTSRNEKNVDFSAHQPTKWLPPPLEAEENAEAWLRLPLEVEKKAEESHRKSWGKLQIAKEAEES